MLSIQGFRYVLIALKKIWKIVSVDGCFACSIFQLLYMYLLCVLGIFGKNNIR